MDRIDSVKSHFNTKNSKRLGFSLSDQMQQLYPLRKYQIYKTIILNNLYGVDIMEEAVAICKLRLFLKLISQVEQNDDLPNLGIEPLPDIDFNILSGNTLVGFSKMEEVEKAFEEGDNHGLAFYANEIDIIKKHVGDLEVLHDTFIKRQTTEINDSPKESILTLKDKIRQDSQALNKKLNLYLAKLYGINTSKKKDLKAWQTSHKPFHWIVEFYGIISGGGFDVIIGNPPYVEYAKVKSEYTVRGYETLECGNLYAFVMERCLSLINEVSSFSFIIPSASCTTPRMAKLMYTMSIYQNIWISLFDERPSKLFYGVDQQLAIFTASKLDKITNLYITSMKHRATNPSDERQFLFASLKYNCIDKDLRIAEVISKIDYDKELALLVKILSVKSINRDEVFYNKSKSKIYYRNAGGRYWKLVKSFPTYFKSDSRKDKTSTEKELTVNQKYLAELVVLYSSSLFYWYWRVVSNCRHLTNREFESFPIPDFFNNENCILKLKELSDKYEASLKENKFRKEIFNSNSGKIIQDEFYVRLSKPIIDEINRVLASHYGFTEEELDYIINYDIKYRMGAEANEE